MPVVDSASPCGEEEEESVEESVDCRGRVRWAMKSEGE